MIRVAVVGLGKMGISHQALINAHPDVQLAAVCDSTKYILGVLGKYTGVPTFSDYRRMLREAELDAVLIATPSQTHADMVRAAIEHGLHVFCEKPFTLEPGESEELTRLARERGLVTQVGYHHRFIATFREVKRILDAGSIGTVSHGLGEAYGPVILGAKGGTWRSRSDQGGGCLYDYAAHPVDLLTWYLGEPRGVGGSALNSVFSPEIEDEVFSTLFFSDHVTGQVSAQWSDESHRKMTTRVTVWGSAGSIYADRQECRVYLRDSARPPDGYRHGWNVRYTTELTEPVWFNLRGEEYSAQIDHFVSRVQAGQADGINSFASAAATDKVISLIADDARKGPSTTLIGRPPVPPARAKRRWRFGRKRA